MSLHAPRGDTPPLTPTSPSPQPRARGDGGRMATRTPAPLRLSSPPCPRVLLCWVLPLPFPHLSPCPSSTLSLHFSFLLHHLAQLSSPSLPSPLHGRYKPFLSLYRLVKRCPGWRHRTQLLGQEMTWASCLLLPGRGAQGARSGFSRVFRCPRCGKEPRGSWGSARCSPGTVVFPKAPPRI